MVFTKAYPLPDFDRREIMRYAGVKEEEPTMECELDRCLALCSGAFHGKVCYSRVPVKADGDAVIMPFAVMKSAALAKNLSGCDEAAVFAATVGAEIDRLIRRYSAVDVATAVWLQAIGAERAEALCGVFCNELEALVAREGRHIRPRFSPGYGDLSITVQRELTDFLDCRRKIGVTLGENMLMSPGKSVTAIVGIGVEPCGEGGGCGACEKTDCEYRNR